MSEQTDLFNYLFRLILVGDFGVGKSSVLNRFINGTFNPKHMSTFGIDFAIRIFEVNKKSVKLQIWDTAGQERFRVITNSYYRNKDCYILVFDLTNMKTFENLKMWMNEIKMFSGNPNPLFFIIGTKKDLSNNIIMIKENVEQFMKEHNILGYYETSSKNEISNDNIFQEITKILINNENIKNMNNNNMNNNMNNNILFNSRINVLTSEPSTKCCYYI